MDLAQLFNVPYFTEAARHYVIWGVLIGFLITYFLLRFWVRYDGVTQERELWITSIVWAIYCIIGISIIGNISINRHLHEGRQASEYVINSPQDLTKFLDKHTPKDQPPVFIPTGLLVQSIEFASAYNVKVSGYIWQRITKKMLAQGIKPGIIMPEGDIVTFGEPAYRQKNSEDEEVLGWYFSTTLREPFFYDKYPLDKQDIWLRIWPTEFYKNVVLVPDYKGYPGIYFGASANKTNAGFLGLDSQIVLERWQIKDVFFSYHLTSYTTNFGIDHYSGQAAFPELYYNVNVNRDFADAFFANIIPPIVVIVLAFMGLTLSNRIEAVFEKHNTASSAMLAYYGMLFFIPITSQVSMRREVNAQGTTFLDYFYFASYIALLLVSLNAILINSHYQWKWLTWQNNLIPKVAFFPIIMTLLMMATIYVYY